MLGASSCQDSASSLGALLGFYHGARLVACERVQVTLVGAWLAAIAPAIGPMIQLDVDAIQQGRLDAPEASMWTCWASMEVLLRHAREAAIDRSFPTFAAGAFERGMVDGFEQRGSAAFIEVLRRTVLSAGPT